MAYMNLLMIEQCRQFTHGSHPCKNMVTTKQHTHKTTNNSVKVQCIHSAEPD